MRPCGIEVPFPVKEVALGQPSAGNKGSDPGSV